MQEKRDWLFRAVRAGACGHVRRHLDEPRLAEARDRHGRTPLHAAVLWEHADIVRLITSKFPYIVHRGDNVSGEAGGGGGGAGSLVRRFHWRI